MNNVQDCRCGSARGDHVLVAIKKTGESIADVIGHSGLDEQWQCSFLINQDDME